MKTIPLKIILVFLMPSFIFGCWPKPKKSEVKVNYRDVCNVSIKILDTDPIKIFPNDNSPLVEWVVLITKQGSPDKIQMSKLSKKYGRIPMTLAGRCGENFQGRVLKTIINLNETPFENTKNNMQDKKLSCLITKEEEGFVLHFCELPERRFEFALHYETPNNVNTQIFSDDTLVHQYHQVMPDILPALGEGFSLPPSYAGKHKIKILDKNIAIHWEKEVSFKKDNPYCAFFVDVDNKNIQILCQAKPFGFQ